MADTLAPGLDGKRIGVTRARHSMHGAMQAVARLGGIPVALPAIEFRPLSSERLGPARTAVRTSNWVVLSSANAVRAIARWPELRELPSGQSTQFAVMGAATGRELHTALGVEPTCTFRSDEPLESQLDLAPSESATVLHSTVGPGPALSQLCASSGHIRGFPVYETRCASGLPAVLDRSGSRLDAITFTSGSCVRCFLTAISCQAEPPSFLHGVLVACLGTTSRSAVQAAGMRVDVFVENMGFSGLLERLASRFQECQPTCKDRQTP